MVFVKITVLFKKEPEKIAETEDDLAMREMHVRADTVRNIYKVHPLDKTILAQSVVVTDTGSYTVLETEEEVLERLAEALEKWKQLPK